MTAKIIAVFASLVGCAVFYAQPVTQPRMGAVRDAHARWRTLNGVAGTLLTGPVLFENVSAGASNGSRQVVQTYTELLIAEFDGTVLARQPISNSPMILAISATGNSALAWITGTNTLLSWTSRDLNWRSVSVAAHGTVLALGSDGTVASLIVRREDRWSRLTVDLTSSDTTAELALQPLSNIVQLAPNGSLLWAEGQNLHQLDTAGTETLAPVPIAASSLSALGPNWWQVTGENGQSGAVRCQGNQIDWFEFPPGDEQ